MNAFDQALADLHADPNIAIPATWREQAAGPGIAIRVVRMIAEQDITFGQKVQTHTETLHIRKADVPALRGGDAITLPTPDGTTAYTLIITTVNSDAEGLTWIAETRRT